MLCPGLKPPRTSAKRGLKQRLQTSEAELLIPGMQVFGSQCGMEQPDATSISKPMSSLSTPQIIHLTLSDPHALFPKTYILPITKSSGTIWIHGLADHGIGTTRSTGTWDSEDTLHSSSSEHTITSLLRGTSRWYRCGPANSIQAGRSTLRINADLTSCQKSNAASILSGGPTAAIGKLRHSPPDYMERKHNVHTDAERYRSGSWLYACCCRPHGHTAPRGSLGMKHYDFRIDPQAPAIRFEAVSLELLHG